MFGIGGGEIIFIVFIALMLFGTDKLPETMRGLAKIMAKLKNASNEIKSEITKSMDEQGVTETFKSVSSNFTDEVQNIKNGVIENTSNSIADATKSVEKAKEDFENLTGSIKRQL